jgi:hypothetical protein
MMVHAIAGCKIRITVPEGGKVVSSSGAYDCESRQTCEINVSDIFFGDTFSGQPKDGYFFRKWDLVDRGFCGNAFDACRLNTSVFEGNEKLEKILESDQVFFLHPMFTKGECVSKTNTYPWTFDDVEYVEFTEWQECTAPNEPKKVKHGLERISEDGKLYIETLWDLGQQLRVINYHENGNKFVEIIGNHFNSEPIREIYYDEEGRVTSSGQFIDGLTKKIGRWVYYSYSESGQIKSKSTAFYDEKSRRIGDWVTKYPDKGLRVITTYENDDTVLYRRTLSPEYCSVYYPTLHEQIEMSDGSYNGSAERHLCSGAHYTGTYVDGEKHGDWYYYNPYEPEVIASKVTWVNGVEDHDSFISYVE